MSQHDYVIANGTGAAVRSDLNNALAAIVTQNSGATAPATTYAYQWWADTTTGLLKLRNAANNAWITLFQLDGEWSTLAVENGSASAPSIYFKDSGTDTGIYSPGTDQVAISTGGAQRLLVDASGNITASNSISTTISSKTAEFNAAGGSIYASFNDGTKTWRAGAGIISAGLFTIRNNTDALNPVNITSAGLVGIGSTAPDSKLDVRDDSEFGILTVRRSTSPTVNMGFGINSAQTEAAINYQTSAGLKFTQSGSERARLDGSGRLLVGTSTARSNFYNQASTYTPSFQLENTAGASGGSMASLVSSSANAFGAYLVLGHQRSGTIGGNTIVNSGDTIGAISFHGSDGSEFVEAAYVSCEVDGTPGANDMPGRIVLATTADGATSPTERMVIKNTGTIGVGITNPAFVYSDATGFQIGQPGYALANVSNNTCYFANRKSTDGTLIELAQDNTVEGTISVSGTTVSYNGAHLSRWSQIPGIDPHDKTDRPEILRGTVMSNLDEMCDWIEPESNEAQDNEQLNKTKISDVEGDKNVAGVFQSWDDDDDTWVNDYYLAMTGDFIIRIGAGVTVERGDLLMSAGDGTAKPQDDDIIRSKTIAKVTSTTVSCTYDDGSYCVPCVLMAC